MSSISEDRRARWRGLVNDQVVSGLSVTAWCVSHGIKSNTFHYWRKQLKVPASPSSASWVSVALNPVADAEFLRGDILTLRVGRVSIEVPPDFDSGLLSSVLNLLETRC